MEQVRRAKAADVNRMAEIEVFDYRLFFYPIFKDDGYYFEELCVPALTEEYAREPQRIERSFVYDDGIVKGFVSVNGSRIEKLFVEPAFQGGGVGGALLERAVAVGGNWLQVLEKNPGAIRFYERHGFARTDERQRVDDTGEWFVVMRKK